MGIQPDLIDQVIDGKYRVVKEIGRGGWGIVLLVETVEAPHAQFAIKLLRVDVLMEEDNRKRFAREALALKMLQHPNIVHVYEFGEWRGCPYYLMEVLSGRTLLSLIQEKQCLTIQETADVGMQLASALSKAHAAGIVHRDVTPANILVLQDPILTIKVLDFGLAKFVGIATNSRLTQTGLTLGSCLYMSPEQCRGEVLDSRSDIYAIGCVLYECLMGQPPFPADNNVAAMMQHLHSPIPVLESDTADGAAVLGVFNKILRNCLAKDREQRYQFAGDVLDDLRAIGSIGATVQRHDRMTGQIRIGRELVHAAQLGWTQNIRATVSDTGGSTASPGAEDRSAVQSVATRPRASTATFVVALLCLVVSAFSIYLREYGGLLVAQIESTYQFWTVGRDGIPPGCVRLRGRCVGADNQPLDAVVYVVNGSSAKCASDGSFRLIQPRRNNISIIATYPGRVYAGKITNLSDKQDLVLKPDLYLRRKTTVTLEVEIQAATSKVSTEIVCPETCELEVFPTPRPTDETQAEIGIMTMGFGMYQVSATHGAAFLEVDGSKGSADNILMRTGEECILLRTDGKRAVIRFLTADN